MTLFSKEEYEALIEQQKREIGNLKRMKESTRNQVVEEVLEILKSNVLFPPQQSQKIFKAVVNLKTGDKK